MSVAFDRHKMSNWTSAGPTVNMAMTALPTTAPLTTRPWRASPQVSRLGDSSVGMYERPVDHWTEFTQVPAFAGQIPT